MKKKKKKNPFGFTMVELLCVIVILGIIIAISIPAIWKLIGNQDLQKYNYHEKMVKSAADLYVDQYKRGLPEEYQCFNISYSSLVTNNYLKEEDVTCKGTIQATRKSGNNFTYKYYLECKDKKGKVIKKSDPVPDGCVGIYGKFMIDYVVRFDNKNGKLYDYKWTNKNLYQEYKVLDLSYVSNTYAGIKEVQYSIGNEKNWKSLATNNGNASWTYNQHFDGKIYVRAIDLDGNISEVISYPLKIDKTNPTCVSSGGAKQWVGERTIYGTCSDVGSGCKQKQISKKFTTGVTDTASPGTVYDNVGNSVVCPANQSVWIDVTPPSVKVTTSPSNWKNDSWVNYDVTINITASDTESGLAPSAYSYDGGKTWTNQKSKKFTSTTNVTIWVRDNAGRIAKWSTVYKIKIDKAKPTCISSGGGSNWVGSRVIYGTCKDTGGSGCKQNQISKTWTTTTTTASPGTVYDNAGNATDCPANQQVKIDRFPPVVTITKFTPGKRGNSTTMEEDNSEFNLTPIKVEFTLYDQHSGVNAKTLTIDANGLRYSISGPNSRGVYTATIGAGGYEGYTNVDEYIEQLYDYIQVKDNAGNWSTMDSDADWESLEPILASGWFRTSSSDCTNWYYYINGEKAQGQQVLNLYWNGDYDWSGYYDFYFSGGLLKTGKFQITNDDWWGNYYFKKCKENKYNTNNFYWDFPHGAMIDASCVYIGSSWYDCYPECYKYCADKYGTDGSRGDGLGSCLHSNDGYDKYDKKELNNQIKEDKADCKDSYS